VLTHLEQGARRSGRRLEDLEIVWAVRTGTAATMAEARRLARPTLVHQGIMRVHSRWLEHTTCGSPHFDVPRAVHDIYPTSRTRSDWSRRSPRRRFVPDEVIAQLADRSASSARRSMREADHRPGRAGISSLYSWDSRRRRARAGDAEFPRRGVPAAEGRRATAEAPMNGARLQGRTALITGASRNIGRADRAGLRGRGRRPRAEHARHRTS